MSLLLGHSREELIGRPLLDFVPAARHSDVDLVLNQLERSVAWRGVFPLSTERGELVQLDWHISPHSSPGLRLAIVSDITERLLHEQERESLLDSERAARGEAERANRLKDDFLATLSHELRTPLNAIVGWAQLLNMGGLDEASVREGLQTIERNALAQAQMISDLLEVSRITSGKVRLEVAPLQPGETIEAAISAVVPAADAKGIRILQTLDPGAGPVSGDAARLQQVLWNLLTNAVKFTPKEGKIHVTSQRINSHIEIRITDNGQGISPDLLDHVFERFRQGDASTTREHGGLGLGLAISKQLVEMHGGSIRAESAGVGKGASFVIMLPIMPVRAGITESPVERHRRSEGNQNPAPLAGVRVLVVEDDPDSRALLTRIVTGAGAVPIIADSVDQAIQKIETDRPNVLVSDLGMPGRDGFDLIREVRSRGYSFQEVPAIALTAFARPEDRRRCLLAGFQVHLTKPVDPLELTATIASLVGRTG
jgi:signal transduction histidine kinase